jgi:hypothetical protein
LKRDDTLPGILITALAFGMFMLTIGVNEAAIVIASLSLFYLIVVYWALRATSMLSLILLSI